jgi:hypothetical protein
MNKKISLRQVFSGIVMFLLLSSSLIMTTTSSEIENGENNMLPSIRVYGEENAPYPNQDFDVYWENSIEPESFDFIYWNGEDPFDPGVLAKDSITFNSAYIGMDAGIDVSGGDAAEKVLLRMFYQPDYSHPIDKKMNECSKSILEPVEPFDAVVLETTYALVSYDLNPVPGVANETTFVLPYTFTPNQDTPGMTDAGLVELTDVQKPYSQECGGQITVRKLFESIESGESVNFMDHTFTFQNYQTDLNKVKLQVKYDGNMYGAHHKEKTQYLDIGQTYYFDRNNEMQTYTDPCHRWFIKVDYYFAGTIDVYVGRVLSAGETFYVNGVRYDMPAIFVEETDGSCDDGPCDHLGLKFITFQTPIPKCETVWFKEDSAEGINANVDDWSHVTSQWLANLPKDVYAWVLPPFNGLHYMIDDIDLCDDDYFNGLLLDEEKEALDIKYIIEDGEPRFDSSLAELLMVDDEQYFTWANVYSKPYRFTEFVLPDQELPGEDYEELYEGDDACNNNADGNEYLLTSSFIAPNSEVDLSRWDITKASTDHEIFDRSMHLSPNFIMDPFYEQPRLVFEYDAHNDIDLYVNENSPYPSIRLYGEDEWLYPTQSWSSDNSEWGDLIHMDNFNWDYLMDDFVYPHHLLPFYPGTIQKDSLTFNPAFLDMAYKGEEITVSGGDASEKVFLRMFYEPGYYHGVDDKMQEFSNGLLEEVETFDAIVLETTYFLVDQYRNPTLGKPDETWFMFPYQSNNPDIPGMDSAGIVKLSYADCGSVPEGDTDVLTDGNISVEKMFYDVGPGESISFMDHTLTFHNYEPLLDTAKVTITYDGNMYGAHEKSKISHLEIGKTHYFDRNNIMQNYTDPANRWYVNVTYYHEDSTQKIDVVIGRYLSAGETFYVNGVRYDMPAIYVDEMNNECGFKYITLQTPLPKCTTQMWFNENEGENEDLDQNVNDWSHVTSQWLANVLPNTDEYEGYPHNFFWVLPPFNEGHTMLDDIGLIKHDLGEGYPDWEIPLKGMIVDDDIPPLEFCYIAETTEPRFDSNIAERFYPDEDVWRLWNIYTMPNKYTEFILPNQETKDSTYVQEEESMWYYNAHPYADGNEYLLSSSWWAQNSNPSELCDLSKEYYDSHDIFDIYEYVMYEYVTSDMLIPFVPKFTFEFDAENGTGIYINKMNPEYYPPTADAGGPYFVCGEGLEVHFDASGSHDNDEGGDSIVQYDWQFYEGDTWHEDLGPTPYYSYPGEGTYTVTVRVKDNEGVTGTDEATVHANINCVGLILDDCNVPIEGQGSAKLWIENVQDLGSFDAKITFDTEIVTCVDFDDAESNLDAVTSFIDNDNGEISLNGYSMTGLTGDVVIGHIVFQSNPTASVGDSFYAEFDESHLFDNSAAGNEIPHSTVNGEITIILDGSGIADFSGNGETNSHDVRYLALHLLGAEGYEDPHGCNPNVNCNDGANSADVRYLAMHLNDDPLYAVLYPGCDPYL